MKVLFATLLILILSGCGLFTKKEPEKVYITKTEYVTVTIADSLRAKCKHTKPIPIEEYMSLTPIEREEYLTDYSIELLGNIKDCETQKNKVIQTVDKTNELFKGKPDEHKSKD